MKRVILIIALFLSSVCHAQTDTVFWFAPPDLSSEFGETPIRLVFHTYEQPATITLEQPANSAFPTNNFVLPAHSVLAHDLSPWVDTIETKPINTVLNRGFHIHSTAPITCYYQSISSNRETYTLKGRNALGTDFDVLTPLSYMSTPWSDRGQSIEIIATEDSTIISITAPNFVDTVRGNDPWWHYNRGDAVFEGDLWPDSTMTILLNRGQSYAMRAKHYDTEIIRTRIRSTLPIAVNTTADPCMSRDMAGDTTHRFNLSGEQLLPKRFWGSEYFLFNTSSYSEALRQAAGRDSSELYYYGWWNWTTPIIYFIDDRWGLKGAGIIVQADPNSQMGATILPQLDCAGSHKVSYLRSDSMSITIHMVTESSAINDILFNGDSTIITAADFQPIPRRSDLSWCVKDVSPYLAPDAVMNIRCDMAKFILAIIESSPDRGTSYTYLTDYAPYPAIQFNMDTDYCTGDNIEFSFYTSNIDSLSIHCPNGEVLSTPPYIILDADTTLSGIYIVEGYTQSECHSVVYDTINIHVNHSVRTDLYDTITENQLPWSRFGILFHGETDTLILQTNPLSPCNNVYHYHLHILPAVGDTVLYYACEDNLPVQYDTAWFAQEGQGLFHFIGIHGEDSLVTFILHVIPSSDTTICDSITEDQLPWFAMDTVFNDTVADYIYHTFNEAGCDSIIHYNLYIFWNGDHCDTALSYPNVVTPNGDGVNDRFVIGGLIEHSCFKYNELTIYDRYGHCVYHKRNIATESDWWDPATQRAPSGTYFFYFKAHGVNIWTQHRGVIEVLRDK